MGHLTGRRLGASMLLAVALSALTGCGDSTGQAQEPATEPSTTQSSSSEPEESESTTEVPADAPDCQDVWVDGNKLPRTYQGCVDDAGAYVERDAVGCSSGQKLAIHDDAYWGVLGGTVYAAQGVPRRRSGLPRRNPPVRCLSPTCAAAPHCHATTTRGSSSCSSGLLP